MAYIIVWLATQLHAFNPLLTGTSHPHHHQPASSLGSERSLWSIDLSRAEFIGESPSLTKYYEFPIGPRQDPISSATSWKPLSKIGTVGGPAVQFNHTGSHLTNCK
ncbi:uncharacterized protein F5147DRAFT_686308 [Suillus discolor]|uniref:Uncharacterized protein n=1 Tax=Suillus discolor TaxID=1912936 RepID=A0A9P7F9V5_9AGAM|nr:uncharacterized protein F5147DRAFT_686308 [Suillus discolor]KAG2111687.1 hypothetical protein F5147DRAFT_686308 [Suillus discolor]